MNKPLSKSNVPQPVERQTLNIMTVKEVITQFNMKSPKHRTIHLGERSSSSSKNMCSPRNCFRKGEQKIEDITVKKVCIQFQGRKEGKDSPKREGRLSKSKDKGIFFNQKDGIGSHLSIKLGGQKVKQRDSSTKKKQQFRKKTMLKIMKQFNKVDQKTDKGKENVPKLPISKIKNLFNNKRPKPLSDRLSNDQPKVNLQRTTTNKTFQKIKLDIRPQNDLLTSKNNTEDQNYFRKGSSASTMSLKSKHTLSMQCFEEYQELFSKQSSKILRQEKVNHLFTLEQMKSKIYSQIESLDKKLHVEHRNSSSHELSKICLKKKNIQVVNK